MGKKFRGWALSLAAVATLTPTGLLGAAPAAADDEGYERCPEDAYCLFTGPNGSGEMFSVREDSPDLGALTHRGHSDWNRTAEDAHLFTKTHFGGCAAITLAGDKGTFADEFRNMFGSVKLGGPGGPSC